jgi:hypothetical protein
MLFHLCDSVKTSVLMLLQHCDRIKADAIALLKNWNGTMRSVWIGFEKGNSDETDG